MTKERYNELVELLYKTKNSMQPPRILVEDFNDWIKRFSLVKFLTVAPLNYYKEALEILKTFVDEPLDKNSEENPEEYYVQQMAWALKYTAVIYTLLGDNDAALNYINRAIKLAESYDYNYYESVIRGELVFEKLSILEDMGRKEDAAIEADRIIEEHKNSKVVNNSYIFFGYLFKAHQAAQNNKIDEIKPLLLKVFEFTKEPEKYKKYREKLEKYDIRSLTAGEEVYNNLCDYLPNTMTEVLDWDMLKEQII